MPTSGEGAPRRRARQSATQAEKAAWQERVERHFGALLEPYGVALTKAHAWIWKTSVTYATATTTLTVERSREFNDVEARAQRKPDWILPGQPNYSTINFTHEPLSMFERARLRARPERDLAALLTGLQPLEDTPHRCVSQTKPDEGDEDPATLRRSRRVSPAQLASSPNHLATPPL
jgi:hypothetical protein